MVVIQVDLEEKHIAIAARPGAPFAGIDGGFDNFYKNASSVLASDFDITPNDLETVELSTVFNFENTPPLPSSVLDILWDKEIMKDIAGVGLTPLETEQEILFSPKEPNFRCRLNARWSVRNINEKPNESRKSKLQFSFGVAMVGGYSAYKSIQDLNVQFLLTSWKLIQNFHDSIVTKK
ncbi:MAG: hypothetical protein ACLQUR_14675 [Limisphaerales bacterium]